MFYLLLTAFFGTFTAGVAKSSEMGRLRRLPVVGSNYVCATVLAGGGWAWAGAPLPSPLTLGVGALGGVFFAGALFLWMGAVARAGVAISTAALRMAVVWPTVLSIVFFAEIPTALQTGGIVLALAAILLITLAGPGGWKVGAESGAAWLLATFIVAGGTGTTLKFFTELGPPAEKPALLGLIFLCAGLLCWIPMVWRRMAPTGKEMAFGVAFGGGNFLGNFFMLLGLAEVPGVVAFPLTHAGTMAGATLLGVLVWREKPGRRGWGALALSAAAMVLMR